MCFMNAAEKQRLEAIACRIRMGVIEGTYAAKCGHPGGSLSAAELMTYLYFCEMDVRPDEPDWSERDRFVLSKGHAAPVLYAALAERGFFPREDLKTLRQIGSHLQGHPALGKTPGVDMSTGSLGQGVSAAVGMALGGKLGRRDYRVYTLLGDGEIAEGQCWEAMMSAAHYKLDNLVIIVDFNGLQIDGRVTDVMDPQPLDEKMRAFGLFTQMIDGHSFDEIENALERAKLEKSRPSGIIMNTVKGRGVSFMEDKAEWHGKATNTEQYEQAMSELRAKLSLINGGVR